MGLAGQLPKAMQVLQAGWDGTGVYSLFCEQTILNLQLSLKHIHTIAEPGKALLIGLLWAQAYAGISQPLWEYPHAPCPDVPDP